MKCCQVNLSGKVQGVFFRKFTKQKAVELGIKGFVKNKPDGSVYVEACGEDNSLKRFVDWCHQGPEKAIIEQVLVKEMEVKNFPSFEIKHF